MNLSLPPIMENGEIGNTNWDLSIFWKKMENSGQKFG